MCCSLFVESCDFVRLLETLTATTSTTVDCAVFAKRMGFWRSTTLKSRWIGERERLLYTPFRLALFHLLAVGAGLGAHAQATQNPDPAIAPRPPYLDQTAGVPGVSTILRGANAGLTFSGVHDSTIGWYTVATPAASYTFASHYSADASLSIYPYRLAPNESFMAPSNDLLVPTHGDLGDTWIGLHARSNPQHIQNTSTASMTIPTGNRSDGLSTGRVTFDLSDHMERYWGKVGVLLDLGGGDSSELFNPLVAKDESALGPIAHFQTGLILWLPGRNYIQSLAYEQLPLGDQKEYTTLTVPGGGQGITVVSGRRVTEDNGFTTSVGIPLTSHITFLSYYNRSLRLHLDTVSTGISYAFKGTPIRRNPSLIDKALLEGERSIDAEPAR